jgi:hypothetical protein
LRTPERYAVVQTREVEQGLHQPPQAFGLLQGRPHRLGVGLGDPVDDVLQDRPQAGDGGAQLVGDVRHQLLALTVLRLQLVGHEIDRVGEVAQLVPAVLADPAGVVAAGDGPGDRVHLVQGGGERMRDELRDQECGDHREHRDEAQLRLGVHGDHRQTGRDQDRDDDERTELRLDREGTQTAQRSRALA